MTVTVLGLDRLTSTMDRAAAQLADLAAVNRAAAARVAAAARPPVATGRLASSRQVTSSATEATVAYTIRYARFPEYGTRYYTGRHYLARAFTSTRAANTAAYATHTHAAIASIQGA